MQPCPICPHSFNPIRGDGPLPCPYLFIGERPGENENKLQNVFVGKAGEELDETYLKIAGFRRPDVRITNSVKCWAENNKTPTDKELWGCARHWLPREIEACKPEVIVLLGSTACKLTKGAGIEINLETHHGRPQKVKGFMGVYDGWVWPTYHPALGLLKTDAMTPLLEDFELLGKWLRHRWMPPTYHSVPGNYSLIRHAGQMQTLRGAKQIAIDTESHGGEPFSIQWASTPGHAYMALLTKEYGWAVKELAAIVKGKEIVLHNAPGDLDLLEKAGIRVDKFRDTMQEAFQQGNLPQKLKALAYRLFGVTMRTWEDVVAPASRDKAVGWMAEALSIAQADLSLIDLKPMKTRLCKACKCRAHLRKACGRCGCGKGEETIPWVKETPRKSPVESALIRMIRCSNNPEYDLWEKADELWTKNEGMFDDDRVYIEARIGKLPILGIGNCKPADAVQYGCGDADFTLQVERKLEERRGDGSWQIDDEDADA